MEWGKAVGTHRRYVGLESRGYLETFENLSGVVPGEGESQGESHGYDGYEKASLSGKKSSQGLSQGDEGYYLVH